MHDSDRTNELTDRIMTRIGEMHLKAQLGSPKDPLYGQQVDPRDEIRKVIFIWLTEEKENG